MSSSPVSNRSNLEFLSYFFMKIIKIIRKIKSKIFRTKFVGSKNYWSVRYARGGNSGPGSYGDLAYFKAGFLNDFVEQNKIKSVIEWGCGDGNQLALSKYPLYIGFDVSQYAVSICKENFLNDNNKKFRLAEDYKGEKADLTLSLDVIFHLVEDDVFFDYMKRLFDSSNNFVIIYSSDTDDNRDNHADHVKHRQFSIWVEKNKPEWYLKSKTPNEYKYNGNIEKTSFSDFFVYQKK